MLKIVVWNYTVESANMQRCYLPFVSSCVSQYALALHDNLTCFLTRALVRLALPSLSPLIDTVVLPLVLPLRAAPVRRTGVIASDETISGAVPVDLRRREAAVGGLRTVSGGAVFEPVAECRADRRRGGSSGATSSNASSPCTSPPLSTSFESNSIPSTGTSRGVSTVAVAVGESKDDNEDSDPDAEENCEAGSFRLPRAVLSDGAGPFEEDGADSSGSTSEGSALTTAKGIDNSACSSGARNGEPFTARLSWM